LIFKRLSSPLGCVQRCFTSNLNSCLARGLKPNGTVLFASQYRLIYSCTTDTLQPLAVHFRYCLKKLFRQHPKLSDQPLSVMYLTIRVMMALVGAVRATTNKVSVGTACSHQLIDRNQWRGLA
jgi:hypothetical protein